MWAKSPSTALEKKQRMTGTELCCKVNTLIEVVGKVIRNGKPNYTAT